MTYEFLSPEWIDAAHAIREEVGDPESVPVTMRMNLIVTEVPFTSDRLEAHLDTSKGALALEQGHHPSPDMVITVDWQTAKALLIEGKAQAAMSAFMAGKIKVEGDMAKLVELQTIKPDERSERVIVRLREITA